MLILETGSANKVLFAAAQCATTKKHTKMERSHEGRMSVVARLPARKEQTSQLMTVLPFLFLRNTPASTVKANLEYGP